MNFRIFIDSHSVHNTLLFNNLVILSSILHQHFSYVYSISQAIFRLSKYISALETNFYLATYVAGQVSIT